ncbi:succinate dehydrogenase iron-sulfur subunit, partial [Burkholderia sp. SIMBA_045]
MNDPRTLHIYRYDPDRDAAPYMQRYEIDVSADDRMLLDVLGRLKHDDETLSY